MKELQFKDTIILTVMVTVIFLHGLYGNSKFMKPLATHVEKQTGLKTLCLDYPSTRYSLDLLCVDLLNIIKSRIPKNEHVIAVTYSMGGIVLRHMMNYSGVNWCGSVMIAPPNQGSAVARFFCSGALKHPFAFIYGEAGAQLGVGVSERANWPAPPQPCAVIAGTQHLDVTPVSWFTYSFGVLSSPNDGTVSLAETHLDSEYKLHEVKATHNTIIRHTDTFAIVTNFVNEAMQKTMIE